MLVAFKKPLILKYIVNMLSFRPIGVALTNSDILLNDLESLWLNALAEVWMTAFQKSGDEANREAI